MTEVKCTDAGALIGKYLRETHQLKPELYSLSDVDIGERIFNSHPRGELCLFFELYYEARSYYGVAE